MIQDSTAISVRVLVCNATASRLDRVPNGAVLQKGKATKKKGSCALCIIPLHLALSLPLLRAALLGWVGTGERSRVRDAEGMARNSSLIQLQHVEKKRTYAGFTPHWSCSGWWLFDQDEPPFSVCTAALGLSLLDLHYCKTLTVPGLRNETDPRKIAPKIRHEWHQWFLKGKSNQSNLHKQILIY